MLDTIGSKIAKLLIFLFVLGLVITLIQFMTGSIDVSAVFEKIILQYIPTEVNIIKIFASVPIIMLLVLFFFIRYIKPHL